VSIVTSDEGTGIINKRGQYVLEPNVNYFIYPVKLPERYFKTNEYIKGLYEVNNSSIKKCGYFYQNHLVVPISEDYFSTDVFFPFICFKNKNNKDSCGVMNVETGEKYIGSIDSKINVVRIQYKDAKGKEIVRYFDKECGDELFLKTTSQYGVEIIKDDNGTYSLKKQNDSIFVGEKYKYCSTYGWSNNIIVFSDYHGFKAFNGQGKCILHVVPENNSDCVVLNAYPSKNKNGNGAIVHCLEGKLSDKGIFDFYSTLYDGNGNKLYEGNNVHFLIEDWYYCLRNNGKTEIVHTAPFKVYSFDFFEPVYCNGMITMQEKNDKKTYAIINTETGKLIRGLKYRKIHPYNEGIAIAETSSFSKVAIDREGREVINNCSQYVIVSDKASDGVIGVRFSDYTYGYIYSNASLNHNQNPYDKGIKLFKEGKYAKAKSLFYNVMINDPTNTDCINYYGCCLERLGYYDSAIDAFLTILRIDPNNKLAIDNIEVCKQNKLIAEQNAQYSYDNAMTWFDGLTQFFNILGDAFTQYSDYTNDMNASRNTGYNYQNSSNNNKSNRQSGSDNVNKSHDARTYSDLETQLIKMNTYYNTYNDNQRRSIQSQMRSIRTKWENRGFRMYHSSWEDWDGRKR